MKNNKNHNWEAYFYHQKGYGKIDYGGVGGLCDERKSGRSGG